MNPRIWAGVALALLSAGCSERETNVKDEEEWAEIEALADDARPEISIASRLEKDNGGDLDVPVDEFEAFIQRLDEMKSISRASGETLLTGQRLELDYDAGMVMMERDVIVEDDQGVLTTERLTGRFSSEGEFELRSVEARGGLNVVSEERHARSEEGFYNHEEGLLVLSGGARAWESTNSIAANRLRVWIGEDNEFARVTGEGDVEARHGDLIGRGQSGLYDATTEYALLEGRASVTRGVNRIEGERLQVWLTEGERKVICEPNVVLVGAAGAFEMNGVATDSEEDPTEIRGNRLVYDQKAARIDLDGAVRVRDPRAAMNCDAVRLYLKEDDEIDWIEALGEVIIQIGGIDGLPANAEYVKALAERATYHAAEGVFGLEIEPKVKVGQNVMTGEKIKFWVEPWRMVCEPDARLLLYLDEDTKAKFLKDLNE